MSASTVSIRASSRRRPLLSIDRNNNTTAASSVELLGFQTTTITTNNVNKSGTRGQENGDVVGGGGGGDWIDNRGKRSSSLLLERPRDGAVPVKDLGLRDGVVSPRRSGKRVSHKGVKPWWLTMLSIFVKNLVLLLVVLGFVQLIYKLAVRSSGGVDVGVGNESGLEGVVELEGRLAELEKTWKKTAKLMQVQVEVVDRKVAVEVTALKEELSKMIEEKSDFLGNEVRKRDGKIETLESALGQLSLDDFLTKEEFDRFYEKLKKTGSGDKELSLDEVRAYAKELVVTEIEKHAADGLGRVDYALASGGGMVIKHSEPFRVGKWGWTKKSVLNAVHEQAIRMLRPSFGEPGQCFPLSKSSGFIQIRLRTDILPEAITLEHVAKSVAYDRSSAPKDCKVYGWLQGPEEPSTQDNAENMILLSEFTYDLDKSSAQTFPVSDSALVNMVRLDFLSNHGSPSHTCIYRLRVHGHDPKSAPAHHDVSP